VRSAASTTVRRRRETASSLGSLVAMVDDCRWGGRPRRIASESAARRCR
jgi:hypothetical protein